ncbi:MAG: Uma2 family endonuclease [Bryobacteraceae bacterium]|jgi:Uma2 family endonuclease
MATRGTTLVSIEEYLSSTYEPDCDYVDGVLEERNLGEYDHGNLQTTISAYLKYRARSWSVRVIVELRIRVSATRVRVPDISVILRDREIEEVPSKPPLVCIEVLSPEDRWPRVEKRIEDFLAMGVERVWVFDPKKGEVFEYTKSGRRQVVEDLLEAPPVSIRISELMAELD